MSNHCVEYRRQCALPRLLHGNRFKTTHTGQTQWQVMFILIQTSHMTNITFVCLRQLIPQTNHFIANADPWTSSLCNYKKIFYSVWLGKFI